jgi:hypothetical protein
MDIGGILKESIYTVKNNIIIIVPTIVVSVIIAFLTLLLIGGGNASIPVMGDEELGDPSAMMPAAGGLMGMLLVIGIISMVLGTISHGVVVAMAKEAIETGKTSINSGINAVVGKIGHLVVAAIIVSLIVMIGIVFFIIPGLIAAFLLMFTFVGIIVKNLNAIEAMQKSFELVKANLKDSIVLFTAILVVGFLFSIASNFLNVIPLIGQLMGLAIMGLSWGYISIVLVRAYSELTKVS